MNSTIVKIGGSLMESPEGLSHLTKALADLWLGGKPLVLAHGGGKDINRNLGWLGEEPRFKNGLRVTSQAAMEVVEMTLSGAVNKRLVSLLQTAGARACGLSGVDGSTLVCRPLDPDLGRVGTIARVQTALIDTLLTNRFLPVLSPVSADTAGQHYNVNADDAAAALATGMQASKLVFVSDVPGVMDAAKHIIPRLNRASAEALIAEGVIAGGMIPKVQSCLAAVEAGVGEVHICGFTTAEALEAQITGTANGGTIVGG
ncbi:MAG TPA: acetylglutamate kinase [Fibrobacteria bacterium]|nr:acetylglutamate kinase [Fibrobacteria bacterium]